MRNYMEQRCRKIILIEGGCFLFMLAFGIIMMCLFGGNSNTKLAITLKICAFFIIIIPFDIFAFLVPAIYCFVKLRDVKKDEQRIERSVGVVTNWNRSSWRKELSKVFLNIDGKEYPSYDCFYYNEASKIVGKSVEYFIHNGKVVITKVLN